MALQQNSPQQQPSRQQVEQALQQMMLKQIQLQKLIWNLVHLAGGEIVIDEAKTDPLWDIRYAKVEGSPTAIRITAALLLEPTEAQMTALVERLVGTRSSPQDEALNVGLVDYPLAYLGARVRQFIDWKDGLWMRKSPANPQPPEHDARPESDPNKV